MPRCLPASVIYVPTCLRANVSKACQRAKSVQNSHFYVPMFQETCQRAIRRANVSTSRDNLSKDVPIFETFLLRNAKGNFYTLILYKKFYIILDIIVIHIICIVHKNCMIHHLYTSCHIKEKCLELLLFETFLLFS